MRPFEDFEAIAVQVEETHIFLRRFGSGPAVLLLHGFPQTHLMWRSVAPLLARRFTVICADLRGYGKSGCPPLLRITRPMRSGRWRKIWFLSWRSSDSRASVSPGMIAVVGSRIDLHSITRSEWNVSLSLTSFRPRTRESGPISG
jgi:pimeloyl-ACP methyl ester carboxylesterase